jgi:methionyl-tRNA formyltransferase
MTSALRVIFAGTPEFAAVALAQILAAGHTVPLVLTQPDRPAGRGMKLQASAVKQLALQHDIPVSQPLSLRRDGKYPDDAAAAQKAIDNAQADVMVVAAYGLILPQWTLDAPRLGCLNIHASLLPRWRGAAPIHRAIEAGDAQTGVVIMQMDVGLDTGDMLLTQVCDIAPDDTTASLHDRLADIGGSLVVRALADAQAGHLQAIQQPEVGITYAHKIEKAEALVNWQESADVIGRRVRAFNPFPAACTQWGADVIKLWRATVETTPHHQAPGTVLSADAHGVRVACGNGVLCVNELQRAGGKRLNAAEFLRGFPLAVGQRFETHTAN